MNQEKGKRAQFLANIGHFLTAVVIAMKGLDKVELGKPVIGSILVVIALIIATGTILHHRMEKYLKHFVAVIYISEAIVMSIVAYLYMKDGKQYIQYACLAA